MRTLPGHPFSSLRLTTLLAVVLLQAASAIFFIGDFFWEIHLSGLVSHTSFEGLATFGLVSGVLFGVAEMARIQRSARMAENSLKIAANAFGEMITERFETWSLSASERDVALLTIKGFDVEEIARLRKTAISTVRAQQASIYAKSQTHNRGHFVSSFIDALVETPVIASGTSDQGKQET